MLHRPRNTLTYPHVHPYTPTFIFSNLYPNFYSTSGGVQGSVCGHGSAHVTRGCMPTAPWESSNHRCRRRLDRSSAEAGAITLSVPSLHLLPLLLLPLLLLPLLVITSSLLSLYLPSLVTRCNHPYCLSSSLITSSIILQPLLSSYGLVYSLITTSLLL